MPYVKLPKISKDRKNGYLGHKAWFRKNLPKPGGLRVIGERDYNDYCEPSHRWDEEVRKLIIPIQNLERGVFALGVEKSPTPRSKVEVAAIRISSIQEWNEFKNKYKVLMLVYKWHPTKKQE